MTSVLDISKRATNFLLIVFPVFLLASCAHKMYFETSTVAPAAEGYVKIKSDHNNNMTLYVSVKNLAEPQRLPDPKSLYVVWMETDKNGIKNIGVLKSGSGRLSSKLSGDLTAVTSFKPTRIFLTAENEQAISSPDGQRVLATRSF